MKSITAVIDWYGPYSLEEAQNASFDYEDGLYAVISRVAGQGKQHLQYIGIANDLSKRLNGRHHKIPTIIEDCTFDHAIWLGEVGSPRSPGRKIKVTDRLLDLAEWAHIYFLQLPLNEKKKSRPPDREITVYNRWWKKDYKTAYLKRPHNDWPDLIDFVGLGYNAKVVWFGRKLVSQSVKAFKKSSTS